MNLNRKMLVCLLMIPISPSFVNAQIARIALKSVGRNIFIKVKAAHTDSLLFGFDTGCTVTFMDSLTAIHAGIKMCKKQQKIAGNTGAQNYRLTTKQTLYLENGIVIKQVNLLLENFDRYKRFSNVEMNGITGYDFLSRYVVKMDFDQQQMLVYNDMKEIDTTGYVAVPFSFHKGVAIPRIPVTITTGKDENFTGSAMFDSGAGTTLVISAPFRNYYKLGTKMKSVDRVKISGVNAESSNERALIEGLRINKFKLGKMVVNSTVDEKTEPRAEYLGLLGMEVIKRFHVIFDYNNKIIYLKPNKQYGTPF